MAKRSFSASDAHSIEIIRARAAAEDSQNSPTLPEVEPKGLPTLPESLDADLTPTQCMAITHLMAGKTLSSVATLLNIDRKTLYNWRQLPAFRAALHSLCQEACEAAAMRMRNILLRGTHRLAAYMEHGDFDQVFKVVANKRVWDMASVMPETETPAAGKEVEPETTQEPTPTASSETLANAAEVGALQPQCGEPTKAATSADEPRAVKHRSPETQRKLRDAARSMGNSSGLSHGLPNLSADEMQNGFHQTHVLRG